MIKLKKEKKMCKNKCVCIQKLTKFRAKKILKNNEKKDKRKRESSVGVKNIKREREN